jgi:hypothetical protein
VLKCLKFKQIDRTPSIHSTNNPITQSPVHQTPNTKKESALAHGPATSGGQGVLPQAR